MMWDQLDRDHPGMTYDWLCPRQATVRHLLLKRQIAHDICDIYYSLFAEISVLGGRDTISALQFRPSRRS